MLKTVVIQLEKSGGYFNGFIGNKIIHSPHPLNIKYFTYSDIWYKNEELNEITNKLDDMGEKYKLLEFKYELYEL
jgi:hypothetical protein